MTQYLNDSIPNDPVRTRWRAQRIGYLHQASVRLNVETHDAPECSLEGVKVIAVRTHRHIEWISPLRQHKGFPIGVEEHEAAIGSNAEPGDGRTPGIRHIRVLPGEIG